MGNTIQNKQHIQKEPEYGQGFRQAEKTFKSFPKDVFQALRMSGEWARLAFKGLDTLPSLQAFTSSLYSAEKALALPKFGATLSKMSYSWISYAKGATDVASDVRTSSFDSVWNFSKVIKWLQKCNVATFGSKFLTNLTAAGGIAFTISSTERLYKDGCKILKLDGSVQKEKFYYVLNVAKNIGTIAIGIIVTLGSLIGLITPPIIFLSLGSMIFIANFVSNQMKLDKSLKLN